MRSFRGTAAWHSGDYTRHRLDRRIHRDRPGEPFARTRSLSRGLRPRLRPVPRATHPRRPCSTRPGKVIVAAAGVSRSLGYPHVFEEYRFHMTLTGRLDPAGARAFSTYYEIAFGTVGSAIWRSIGSRFFVRTPPVNDFASSAIGCSGARNQLTKLVPSRPVGETDGTVVLRIVVFLSSHGLHFANLTRSIQLRRLTLFNSARHPNARRHALIPAPLLSIRPTSSAPQVSGRMRHSTKAEAELPQFA